MTVQLIRKASLLVLILLSYTISAQTVVKGKLSEKTATGEAPLPFANVFLKGTSIGAITNFDGEYSFMVEAGSHTIVFSFVGYNPVEKNFEATGEGEVNINATLSMNNAQLQEVTIKGRANRESENLLMMEQKKAVIAVETMGAVELSRKGISDVASGVKKVTGVSMMGSKQLFVRGLGDRYNSVELNGLPIQSPDPTKKTIKLDIFPSDVVQNLSINKVYSASNFADYTGALINIETKEYPNTPFLSVEVGGKYNSQSTGKEFRRVEADGNTLMNFDIDARSSKTPEDYRVLNRTLTIDNDKFHFNNFGFTTDNARPNMSVSIKGGKLFQLNEKRKLGLITSISFENSYETLPNVLDINTNRQNNMASTFTSTEYTYNSYFTSLLGLTYIPNSKNSIKYTSIFLNNGEDLLKEKIGKSKDWGENRALIRNAQYINYRLLTNQLFGKHTITDKLKLDWAAEVMEVGYNMPDRREIVFQEKSNDTWQFFLLNNGNDTKRIVLQQDAMDYNGKINLSFDLNNQKGKIKIGAATRYQTISLKSYLYGYVFNTNANSNLNIDTDKPNDYITASTISKIKNNTSDDMGYEGNATVNAAYADFVYNIQPNLTVNVGVRAEQSSMTVTSNTIKSNNNEEDYTFENLDFFPSFNIKYSYTSKTNLRFAVSRTVTRPSFFEKSPVSITPELGERRTSGNVYTKETPKSSDGSYLENSFSNNIDLKYEFFPTAGELISIGGYFKQIEEPIEKISIISGGEVNYTFRNFTNNAYAAGLEFEIKRKFNNLFTGLNASYIYTHLTVPEDSPEINKERELQGASPYLINADLGYQLNYNSEKSKSSYVGFTYNVYGKRLYAVGVSGSGNQYELPYHSVDFVLKNKLGNHFEVNASVKNILNQYVEHVQDVYEDVTTNEKTGTQLFKKYKTGVTAGINITYKF